MCALYSKSLLDEIKNRVLITTFIGEKVKLKKAGRSFKGKCPFHQEKTPSFHVSDERGIYHCFGCGEGGDLFQFVMKFEGVDFPEAVKILAERAGVALPSHSDPAFQAEEDKATRKRRLALQVMEVARDYFSSLLVEEKTGRQAREYLQARGIKREFWTQLFLGFADNGWEMLAGHLHEKGLDLSLAAEIGLLKKRERGGYYDFFRNRIMFPIITARGEVVGFSGRDIGGEVAAPKYLNSPDSFLYHKSSSIFGINRALAAIRKEDAVFLVEGNIDLVSLHQAGIENIVAPLGTALTAGHVRQLARCTRNQTLIFDGDEAGVKAALRATDIFAVEGIAARIVPLPMGEDPDSLVRKEGAEVFRKRMTAAPSLFEFFVERTCETMGMNSTGKTQALSRILRLLQLMSDDIQRTVCTAYVSQRFGIEQAVLLRMGRGGERSSLPASIRASDPPASSTERLLFEVLIKHPKFAAETLLQFPPEQFEDKWCQNVAKLMQEKLKANKEETLGDLTEGVADEEFKGELRRIMFGPDRCGDDEAGQFVKDCLKKLKQRPTRQRLSTINHDIRHAEISGDEEKLFALLNEKKRLVREVERPEGLSQSDKI